VVETALGDGLLVRGLERGLRSMARGEEASLLLRPEYAFGLSGRPAAGEGFADVPGGASVMFEVELIGWTAPKREVWEMGAGEVLDEAARLKASGGQAFGAKDYTGALAAYRAAARLLLDEAPLEGYASLGELRAPAGREEEARQLLVACRLNEAACCLRCDEWAAAAAACDAAVSRLSDPLGAEAEANVKALFRRAKARSRSSDFGAARRDLREAARLAPTSREVLLTNS